MPNLAAFLAAREDDPQRLLIRESTVDRIIEWTFGDVAALAARWQAAFMAAKLKLGDRIAVSAGNSAQWLAIDQAALGLGCVVVALDPQASARFAATSIAHSGANLLLIDSASRARDILSAGPAIEKVVMLRHLQHGRDRLTSIEDFLPDTPSAPFYVAELEEDALAALCYQNVGSGGIRGIMLSHSNLLAAVHAQQSVRLIQENEAVLAGGSFAQMLARVSGIYLPLSMGAHATIYAADATLEALLDQCSPQVFLCNDEQLTRTAQLARAPLTNAARATNLGAHIDTAWRVATGHGSWLDRAAQHYRAPTLAHALSAATGGQLKRVVCGQPMRNMEAIRQLSAQGVTVLQGLSLDVSGGLVMLNPPAGAVALSCGQSLPGVETRLNERGELLLRGLALAQGYWNDPSATKADIEPEGWVRTGLTAHQEAEHIMMDEISPGIAPQIMQQIPALPD